MFPTKRDDLIHAIGLVMHPEGGYYVEMHRSESCSGTHIPSPNVLDTNVDTKAAGPKATISSIYWIPDLHSPKLHLVTTKSDHVLYFQGGRPCKYWIYDPCEERLEQHVMGPDICNGQILQLHVRGGLWKCGMMVSDKMGEPYEFTVIGQATLDGECADTFCWITKDMVEKECPLPIQKSFKAYIGGEYRSLADNESQEIGEISNQGEVDEDDLAFSPSQNRRLFQLIYEPI